MEKQPSEPIMLTANEVNEMPENMPPAANDTDENPNRIEPRPIGHILPGLVDELRKKRKADGNS